MNLKPVIGKNLCAIFLKIQNQFPYIGICIWETAWLNSFMVHQAFSSNIILEVDKAATKEVFGYLMESNRDVYLNLGKYEVDTYITSGQNSIIVKNLLVTSPIIERDGFNIPSIEKIMVDIFADDELYVIYQGAELQNIYQELFGTFYINQSKLRQYANKRHVKDKLISFIKEETEINKNELLI